MAVLTPQQRTTLESAVQLARKTAEQGAFNVLHAMAVDHPEPFGHMDAKMRSLRNRLRSKARLLGDELQANGIQGINHLSYELAYETWHKMLFAKFLEGTNLLMHPDGVAVTMQDCEELAREEGYIDKWDAAANYASRMLPAIFRIDDPLMQVSFATDDRIKLEGIIDDLESSIFIADDVLGWVYQFWQSEEKKRINESEEKIDGQKLPAVTQLFTEPYMVHFLIDNTLGAWWVSRNPGVRPPVKFEYLRFLEDGTPAAGKFEGWPDRTSEVTSLDPCMGSGHFLASLFPVFAALRMLEEGLGKEEVTDRVITENLHGLEIDPRCTQIAAFNLALTAWKFCGHYKELPEMNLACSGIAPKGKLEDWLKLVGKPNRFEDKSRLENGMKMLYEHFQLAPELGSLLDPTTIQADAFTASFKELQPVLKKALEAEENFEQLDRGVIAAGIAKAGHLLAKKYTLQITNVPYLSRGKQDKVMKSYFDMHYQKAKGDLATVFLDRMSKCCKKDGIISSVSPYNWLLISTYKDFRKQLLVSNSINFIAGLGANSFNTSMYQFEVVLISIKNTKPNIDQKLFFIDVSQYTNLQEKNNSLFYSKIHLLNQVTFLSVPDLRITKYKSVSDLYLFNFAKSYVGVQTGDNERYILKFFELNQLFENWELFQRTPDETTYYKGLDQIIKWDNGHGSLQKGKGFRDNGTLRIKKKLNEKRGGFVVHRMGKLPVAIANAELYDQNGAIIIPEDKTKSLAIYCFLASNEFNELVRTIDKKVGVTPGTLVKVPFNYNHWQKVAAEKYPNGLPKPYSDDPTQWLFHGHPVKTENPLQVALARLLGYRWPAENDTEMELANEARELIAAVKAFDRLSDADGIFCIPSVNSEQGGAERLRDYLQRVFASEWNSQTISQLLHKEGAKSTNLDAWLRDEFFAQHCKVFNNRPFIWHIWDGRKDGFSALVNYHKLTRENLSKLIYTYLGDWIRMCEAKKKAGESGAEGLLSAALTLKEKLEAILEGEAPCDIFVRWKTVEQQPIGWDPDLNDGMRLNIRPFVIAGVLRNKFNVKWGVDRGKNPPGSPWGEKRNNDIHLTLEEKRKVRKNV